MDENQVSILQGNKIEIFEMILKTIDGQLELLWKIKFENRFFRMIFYNVSSISIEEFSYPLEVHGFEIFNHSQKGWEKHNTYEIHDFENGKIRFFCEHLKICELL